MSANFFDRSISWKLFPVLLASVLACGIGVWVGIPIVTEQGVKSDALANAEKTVQQFKVMRGYYTENVIRKVVESGALTPTYTHKGADDEIPLPATFIHELSDLLAESGTTLRLYSPYPFPVRAGRVLDDFGQSAWAALSENPDKPFVRSETIAGRNVVRVAVADTMVSQVCVDCHNSRADSPKDDWRLNDLRGVLEIDTDVTAALARGAGIGRAIALSLLGLLGAVVAFTFFRMRKVVIGPVGAMTDVMAALATGNFDVDVPGRGRRDEIGDMARAVQVFKTNGIELKKTQDELARMNGELSRLNATLEDRVEDRTQELTAANDELESFTYSVSHDLRAPLRTIDGFCQRILSGYSEQMDDRGKDYLVRVRAAVGRMAGLIDDLLELAHSKQGELKKRKINLSEVAALTIDKLREGDESRNVVVDIEPQVSGFGDPSLAGVVLDNLLGNAWKYTGKEEQPHISFGLSERGENGPVYFVKDNGAGFDTKFSSKLFTPFQRLHGADQFEGNGVGLATVQRIIARHGGRVWADAKVGKGATFYFTLGAEV